MSTSSNTSIARNIDIHNVQDLSHLFYSSNQKYPTTFNVVSVNVIDRTKCLLRDLHPSCPERKKEDRIPRCQKVILTVTRRDGGSMSESMQVEKKTPYKTQKLQRALTVTKESRDGPIDIKNITLSTTEQGHNLLHGNLLSQDFVLQLTVVESAT